MAMQYIVFSEAVKIEKRIQLKAVGTGIFLALAQNIDCGYTLESHRADFLL